MWLFNKKNKISSEELAEAYFKEGNKALIGHLFEMHVETVYGTCLFYFRDRDLAKDAVMQIFEKLMLELKKTQVKNFKAWLSFVVRNYCISELRKIKNQHFLPETYLDFELHETSAEQEYELETVSEAQVMQHLHESLGLLKENQRKCIEQFYLQNKSYKEIQETTHLSINEIKSYIQNGKRNLKLALLQKSKNYKNDR